MVQTMAKAAQLQISLQPALAKAAAVEREAARACAARAPPSRVALVSAGLGDGLAK
eukprot:SAG11_NODE_2858_length_2900_cov_1.881471_6_plen_56_part_00